MASPSFELISKKLVKPSFSTPPSLRNYKLSLIDQQMSIMYIPMAFFFPNHHQKLLPTDLLEESLSKTLSSYYPFAGRLTTDNISVDCNDMGATFLEARVKSPLSESRTITISQDIIFPNGFVPWGHAQDDDQPSLFAAQLTHFDCGGKVLTVCLTHKLGDAQTLCNFMNDWAAIARHHQNNDQRIPSPQFIGASIFPPADDPSVLKLWKMELGKEIITRRYVFEPDKISQLKTKASIESEVHNPSKVEVVTALLYKCVVAASKAHSGSFIPSALVINVNLRPLISSSAPENIAGNIISLSSPVKIIEETDMNFSRLVNEIRKKKLQLYEKYKGINTNELDENMQAIEGENNSPVVYGISSFCRFPFYDIDFGWGRPIRVIVADHTVKNIITLMDNYNLDGIEATLCLDEKVMSVLESDPEFLEFASLNSCF